MISKAAYIFRFSLLLLLLLLNYTPAQLRYQVSAESGYFDSRETGIDHNQKLLTRLNGELKYELDKNHKTASVLVNIRPEFYGTKSPPDIIRSKAEAEYFVKEDIFGYGINVSGRNNRYLETDNKMNFNMLFVSGQTELYLLKNFPLAMNFGYAYQQAISEIRQVYNIFFSDLKASNNLFEGFEINYGVYVENFNILNKVNLYPIPSFEANNTGYRWGPQAGISFFKGFIFNIDYNFLFHNSKYTKSPSYEQLFRLVAGSIILKDFSAFILVDYYKRSLRLDNSFQDGISPLYVPLNLENRVYLKLGYDAGALTEIYLKMGYLKENLYNNEYNFAGWHLLAGIQVSN